MNLEDLQQLRLNVLTNVSRLPRIIMDRDYSISDYDSDIAHLNDLEAVLDQLEMIFNLEKEAVSIVLGHEFVSPDIQIDNALEVPLYLYLDMIIDTIDLAMNNTAK